MEWTRRWEINLRWRPGLPGERVGRRRVDTPEQLRAAVAWARANPDITSYRYGAVRELTGDPPPGCHHGHPYDGGSATRPTLGWRNCDCGGHTIYTCRWSGCADVRLDPPADVTCSPGR